ncbi:putative MATE family efflux protein [Alteromonadaceae bacterium 2753L.S.0a.02]|nr:putative MATE family efflux protein [Alteromonadaceae bacterium 2753L.S.0a.02]
MLKPIKPFTQSNQPGTRAFWLSVAGLALPVAMQMVLQSLLGMADVVMVGDLGPMAIAAVGLAAKLHFLLLVVMAGVGAGCSILVAQYTGADDFPACQRTVALAVMFGTAVMVPFTLGFGYLSPYWVKLINPDPEVVALTSRYLQITALVLIFTQLVAIYEAALRALGNTGLPLLMGGMAALLNIFLNYLLIFGHWGLPALGVEGAAWGTLISRGVQIVGILAWLQWQRHGFALRSHSFIAAFDGPTFKRYLSFSIPLIINHIIWGVGNATYHVLTGFAGTDALAVMGVVVPIESLFFALFIGLANAATVMIGRALGGSRNSEAWQLYRFFDRLTLSLVLLFSAALFLLRPLIIRVFDNLDPATEVLLNDTLAIFSLLIWVKVLNMMRILGVLRAGGDNRFVLITDTIVTWGIGLPVFCAGVLWLELPFLAIYVLMYVEDLAKFLPVRIRIRLRAWMNNLAKPQPAIIN